MDGVDKFDCFISHSSKDIAFAVSLVERLESRELKCWVAPRDIEAGSTYSAEIVEGIRTSASLIVLISKESLTSRHVQREVNLADDLRKPIYPVKLIDIEIYGGLSFYLSASQEVRLFEKTGDPVEKLISSIKGASGSRDQRETVVEVETNEAANQVNSGLQQSHEVQAEANKPDSPATANSREYDKRVTEPELREPNKKLPQIASVSVLSLVAVLYFWNKNSSDSEITSITSPETNDTLVTKDTAGLESSSSQSSNEPAITGTKQSDVNETFSTRNDTAPTLDEPVAFIEPEMIIVPAGTFSMGSEYGGSTSTELPVRRVAIAAFEMSRHELTWGEWQKCEAAGVCPVLNRPDWIGALEVVEGAMHPVVSVSWDEARIYIDWINSVTDGGYRLPSEAEFEYALRAGTEEEYPWGQVDQCDHSNGLDQAFKRERPKVPNVPDCDDGFSYTAPVGSFKANAFELFDVSGNAWEWTQDCWNEYDEKAPNDGSARETGDCDRHVLRGGGWNVPFNYPGSLRSANRFWDGRGVGNLPFVGFRLARTL